VQGRQQILAHLTSAQILLLISANFLEYDFCYSIEMKQALARHTVKEARVIPIILRPTDWKVSPFSDLQALPMRGKPVTAWPSHDAALLDIVRGIRKVIADLEVQPWDMVDNSASTLQTPFGTYQPPVFAVYRKILIYLSIRLSQPLCREFVTLSCWSILLREGAKRI